MCCAILQRADWRCKEQTLTSFFQKRNENKTWPLPCRNRRVSDEFKFDSFRKINSIIKKFDLLVATMASTLPLPSIGSTNGSSLSMSMSKFPPMPTQVRFWSPPSSNCIVRQHFQPHTLFYFLSSFVFQRVTVSNLLQVRVTSLLYPIRHGLLVGHLHGFRLNGHSSGRGWSTCFVVDDGCCTSFFRTARESKAQYTQLCNPKKSPCLTRSFPMIATSHDYYPVAPNAKVPKPTIWDVHCGKASIRCFRSL